MTARIAQRTSGPWHISKARAIEVCAAGGKPIAELWINEDTEVNAAFIVEACNAYDTLRAQNAALRAALERTLPLLIRLGDFIANKEGRCETILAVRDAIQERCGGSGNHVPPDSCPDCIGSTA